MVVVPPLFAVVAEAACSHSIAQLVPILPLLRRDGLAVGGGTRVEQIVAAAHVEGAPGFQIDERDVDGDAPAMFRAVPDVAVAVDILLAEMRVKLGFLTIVRACRPRAEVPQGALGAVGVPDEQAETLVGQLFRNASQPLSRLAPQHGAPPRVAVDGAADEVVAAGILQVDTHGRSHGIDVTPASGQSGAEGLRRTAASLAEGTAGAQAEDGEQDG